MKAAPRILLAFTLLLNVVLAAVLWHGGRRDEISLARPDPGGAAQAANPEMTNGAATVEPRVVVVPAPGTSAWQALARHDYRDCMAALRAAGCPEETIRDIILAAVSREYRERIATTQSERLKDFKWWRFQQEPGADYDRFLTQDLRRERDKKLNELLGDDWNKQLSKALGFPGTDNGYWNFISKEKREQLDALTWWDPLESTCRHASLSIL